MSNKSIYNALRSAGLTAEGACGVMGNMMAESGMKANIAQRGMTKLSDEQYTAAADNGLLDFVHDHVGYGLCQWTFYSRKQALLQFAKAQGVSVGDEAMQVQFCIKEIRQEYPNVWRVLTTGHDLYEAARIVCVEYERPAINNVDARYLFARDFFEQLGGESEEPDPTPAPDPDPQPRPEPEPEANLSVMITQLLMWRDGYYHGPIDGFKNAEYRQALPVWAADVARC